MGLSWRRANWDGEQIDTCSRIERCGGERSWYSPSSGPKKNNRFVSAKRSKHGPPRPRELPYSGSATPDHRLWLIVFHSNNCYFAFLLGTGNNSWLCARTGARGGLYRMGSMACTESIRSSLECSGCSSSWRKNSTVPRGYCRNRLKRPNSQACPRIAVQPDV